MAGLQIKISNGQMKTEYGKNILIAVLFMTGWAKMYATAFATISSGWWVFALLGSVICVGMLFMYETKIESLVLVVGLGINIMGLGVSFLFFKDGLLCLANDFLRFLTGRTGRIYLDYPVSNENHAYMAAFWIFFLLALWTAKAVKYRDKITLVILVLIMTGTAVAGLVQVSWGFVLVMAATAIFLFPVENKCENQNREKQKVGLTSTVTNFLCVGMICITVGIFALGMKGDFSTHNGVATVKEQLHKWKYESQSGAMPEGNLSNLGAMKKDEKTALTIMMDEPQKLYLRGMVGEVYTGTEWKTQDAETYIEAEDIFYWLHKTGFYGQNSIGNAMLLAGEEQSGEMTITNVAACSRYQYLPYALVGNQVLDEKAIGNGSVFAKDANEVTVSYVKGSLPQWYRTKTKLVHNQKEQTVQDYLKQEQTYRRFVQEKNLQITNAVIGVCQRMLKDRQDVGTLGEITTMIRNTLNEKLSYSEKIITQNETNDFFQYTLEQSKKGYSVHYATAATLMLRYCGVPARYVEGYFLSADEAAEYEKGETIVLTEAHAHAWAEYYLDGIGWVPFEVTPGYVDEKELLELQNSFAGKENGEHIEQTYTKNSMSYRPPLDLMPEDNSEKEEPLFLLSWQLIRIVAGIILLVLLGIVMYRMLRRRKCLYKILEETQQEDNRSAMIAQYGYAGLLCKYADIIEIEGQQQVQILNQEAIFSNHVMTAEQRQCMEGYLAKVLSICKERWPVWKKIWYRYVLWLYH